TSPQRRPGHVRRTRGPAPARAGATFQPDHADARPAAGAAWRAHGRGPAGVGSGRRACRCADRDGSRAPGVTGGHNGPMRRIRPLLGAACLAVALVGCGGDDDASPTAAPEPTEAPATT